MALTVGHVMVLALALCTLFWHVRETFRHNQRWLATHSMALVSVLQTLLCGCSGDDLPQLLRIGSVPLLMIVS